MLGSEPQKQNQWFADNPGMSELGLRYYQEDAVRAVEKAIVKGQQEILLAMATGTGKTRTAIAMMFRLIQSQRFKRILFLVDRRSLGEQALGAFEDTRINGDTFNSIFDIKGLTDKFPEDSTKIHVATVQSLVKRTLQSDEPMPVARYDCIVVDEAHRGYILDKEQTEGELQFRSQLDYVSAYRRILDHFDAVKIALTATPALHTVQIFGEPVYRYTYRTAVIDGFLIDQDPPIQITTRNAQEGVYLSKGEQVERISPQGEVINDTLEDDQDFEVADFNRGLVIPAFNRAVCNELTNYLDPTGSQKTLVFCVTNAHADMVVEELRAAFKKKYPQLEHDAIIKITGDADKDARKVQTMITRFNKERLPNIVVTVDLLTTGVDIPSICNIVFLRKVRSRILYEQMKGRATRLCPDVNKTSFKIFDCVDIYSTLESVDTMRPVVVRPKVELQTLVNEITDSETYKITEADGRSFAEHSHEQLVAKLQRIIGLATFNRDRSETIDKQVRRLALMNCLLHDIEGNLDHGGAIRLGNTLGSDGENLPKAHIVATNPPFGSAAGTNITRTFVHPTSNKQLCFMQHIIETLHPGGRAAVVVPDNVLFEGGKGTDIRRDLMDKCHLHTILRLPTGIFYAQGVKTNVLFFTKGTVANPHQDKNCTDDVWVYDLRTNMPSFGKRTPFTDEHLQPFERVYGEDPHGLSPRSEGDWEFDAEKSEIADSEENKNTDQHLATSRWRKFSREWIRTAKSDSLDISWLKDKDSIDADSLPEPDVLAAEAMGELVQALGELDALMRELGASDEADAQRQLLEEAFGGVKE